MVNIIYINFRELFNKCLNKAIVQQRIKYQLKDIPLINKNTIVLNKYNLVIDTVLSVLQQIDNIINKIKQIYIKNEKTDKIYIFDIDIDKYNTPINYNGYIYDKLSKKMIGLDVFIKLFARNIKYCNDVYKRYKEFISDSIIKQINKYIVTKELKQPDYIKDNKKGKNKAIEDINELLESHPEDWKEYIKENILTLNNGFTNYFITSKSKQILKIINYNENIINDLKQFYKENDKRYWDSIKLKKYNIVSDVVHKITKEIKKKLFFIQNRLTQNEINDIYYYVLRICKINRINKIDIEDDNINYYIFSKANVIGNEILTDYNNNINKPNNLHFKKFSIKNIDKNYISNSTSNLIKQTNKTTLNKICTNETTDSITAFKEFGTECEINNFHKNITLKTLLEQVTNRNPFVLEEYNDYKNKSIFYKYIVDIDIDRRFNLFIEYEQNILYNDINNSIITDYKYYILNNGINPINVTEEYIKPLKLLFNKYKYNNFVLI